MEAGRYDLSPAASARFEAWTACWAAGALRVLKPGGHLVSFASPRTNHRHVCGLEDAGFEIRDTLMWIFGSGFPKSLNLDGEWEGWGTALKPGYEPITLARKPLAGTVAATVLEHGTGALNIDACRVSTTAPRPARVRDANGADQVVYEGAPMQGSRAVPDTTAGRWPANIVLDEAAAAALDEQSGELTSGAFDGRRSADKFRTAYGSFRGTPEAERPYAANTGGASRFFYCAKADTAERDAGLGALATAPPPGWSSGAANPGTFQDSAPTPRANVHPTVKPIDLMRWLVRLVTPPGGTVLDPFTGSGTTGCAAVLEGFHFVGIEREADYLPIAEGRIRFWAAQPAGVDVDQAIAAAKTRNKVADSGQTTIYEHLEATTDAA